jgi:CheY-like chemotaxis protein
MNSTGRTILVVDGDPDVRDFLAISLGLAGFTIEIAKTNHEALARIKTRVPDLVVVDMAAAWRDGRNLMFRLRRNPGWAHIPVIVITAHVHDEMEIRHLEAYASMRHPKVFLRHPITLTSLAEDIGAILQVKPRRREPTAREKVNDLLIDADAETWEKLFAVLQQEPVEVGV